MPIASTKQSQRERSANTFKKHGLHKGALGFILGIFLVAIVMATFFMQGGEGMLGERREMEQYLEDKYGNRFVVENYRIEGSGFGVEGVPVADAYPTDDSDLRFKVSERGKNTFADTYALTYWSKQGQASLDQEVKQMMPNVRLVTFSVTGDLDQNFHTMENYPFKGTIPDVRTALKDYPGKLKTSFSVHSSVSSTEQEPSPAQLSQAYEVIVFAKTLGIVNGTVGYTYTHPDYDEMNAHGGKVPRYTIIVDASQLERIQSPEQLEQYFKDRESGEK